MNNKNEAKGDVEATSGHENQDWKITTDTSLLITVAALDNNNHSQSADTGQKVSGR